MICKRKVNPDIRQGQFTLDCPCVIMKKIEVTIQKVVSREAFWHIFCQNPETYKAKCHHRR